MGADLDGTNDWYDLSASPHPASNGEFTYHIKANPDVTSANDGLMGVFNGSDFTSLHILNAGDVVQVRLFDSGQASTTSSTTDSFVANAWQSFGFTSNGSNSHFPWYEGVAGTGSISTVTPDLLDTGTFQIGETAGASPFNGQLGEGSVFDIKHTAEVMEGLVHYSALFWLANLVYYAPMRHDTVDRIGGITMSATGAPTLVDSHPDIFQPAGQIVYFPTPSASSAEFSANVSLSTNLSSGLSTGIDFNADLLASLAVTSNLQSNIQFSASISSPFLSSADLQTAIELSGSTNVSLALASDLLTLINLASNISGVLNSTADLQLGKTFSGNVVGNINAASDLQTAIDLASDIAGALNSNADLVVGNSLASDVIASLVATGDLQTAIEMVAAVDSSILTGADLLTAIEFASTVDSLVSVNGDLQTSLEFAGSVNGSVALTAKLMTGLLPDIIQIVHGIQRINRSVSGIQRINRTIEHIGRLS